MKYIAICKESEEFLTRLIVNLLEDGKKRMMNYTDYSLMQFFYFLIEANVDYEVIEKPMPSGFTKKIYRFLLDNSQFQIFLNYKAIVAFLFSHLSSGRKRFTVMEKTFVFKLLAREIGKIYREDPEKLNDVLKNFADAMNTLFVEKKMMYKKIDKWNLISLLLRILRGEYDLITLLA